MDTSVSSADETARLTVPDTKQYRQQVEEAAETLRGRIGELPSTAIATGRSLSLASNSYSVDQSVSFSDIPHMPELEDPVGTDAETGDAGPGRGALEVGDLADRAVTVLRGRRHAYDGATPREVTFPIRLLGTMGIDTLILLGDAVGLGPNQEVGDLFLLTDHINFQGSNPLVGPNVDAWGPRFPDMTEPYDPALRRSVTDAALDRGVRLHKGTYVAVQGPGRQTAAEAQMLRTLGADAVGMSLVPEVIVARHMNIRALGLVLLTAVARASRSGTDVDVARRPPDAASAIVTDLLREFLQAP